MTELEQIITFINDKRQNYINRANEIRADYNRENNTKLSYIGRQIFELLQNADDCYLKDSSGLALENAEVKVKFELRDDLLIVQNSGEPFVPRGILSLMDTDSSSKYAGTIGCKGLGFRSVLNWADEITIYTHNFIANFSEHRAKEQLEFYKKECSRTYINELDGLDRISVLNAIEAWYDEAEIKRWLDEGYTTSIVLHCNESEIEPIRKQLLELKFEELLFLEHIRKIDIIVQGQSRKIQSIKEGVQILIQDGDHFSDWAVWKEQGMLPQENGEEKYYELAIAYNRDEGERERIRKEGYLYSFFKTDIRMPFPFLVHGTFDLTPDRNGLFKQNPSNIILLDKLIDLIVGKAAELAEKEGDCNYDALKFILPAEPISFLDGEYSFSKKLKEKCKERKIFPTINGNYISLTENPKYSNLRFDELVVPSTFSTLLKHCTDLAIRNYLSEIGIGFYNNGELAELLNKDADKYVEDNKNAELIILFIELFPYPSAVPNLLVDNQGKRIVDKTTIFISAESGKDFVLPKWCEMCFLDHQLQQRLQASWNYKSARELVGRLSPFGCSEYAFNRVLGELISQSKDDRDKVAELLQWLYNEWMKNGQEFESSPARLNVRGFSREGEIVFCSKCYFGSEYGNAVGERITSYLKDAIYVADCKSLGFSVRDAGLVKSFLSQLGVVSFPKISSEELGWHEKLEYRKYNAQKFEKLKCYYETFTHDSLFHQSNGLIKISTISGLSNVLENADFFDILYWILNDRDLYRHLESDLEIDSTSYMEGYPTRARSPKRINNDQMRSWLKKQFTEIKWLPTANGGKTNCANCILSNNALSPVVEMVHLNYAGILKFFGKPMKKEIELLLEKLGVAEDIDGLPNTKIYDVLLQLPVLDEGRTLGKHVYARINRKFDKDSVDALIENNPSYDKFLTEGRVLCSFSGERVYVPVRDAYYVDRKIYSDDILDKYPTIILNLRAGDEKIPRIFGVHSIKEIGDIQVDFVTHHLNDEFQREYRRKLPYIYAKHIKYARGTELQNLRDSKIILVESATTTHYVGGVKSVGVLKDYELIYSDKIAYIKIPKDATLSGLRGNMDYKSALAEIVTTILTVDGDKDGYIIIFGCASNREIEEYFQKNGDQTLEDINLAKQRFNASEEDYREEFWNAISKSVGIQTDLLIKKFGHLIPNGFNYGQINSLQNAPFIINLFKELGIDIDDYNDKTFDVITLKPYYNKQFVDLRQQYRGQYFTYRLIQLLEQDGDTRAFEEINRAYSFNEIVPQNSVNYDVVKDFEEAIKVTVDELKTYSPDYEALLKKLRIPETKTEEDTNQRSGTDPQIRDSVNFVKLNEEIARSTDGEVLTPSGEEAEVHGGNSGGHTGHSHKGVVPDGMSDTKETIGFIAESKVFHTLRAKLGDKGAVKWVSGNAVRAGEIALEEGNDSCGYDMCYSDEAGEIHYVEVKGSTSNFEFTITKGEVEFAQTHSDIYEVWFVFVKDKQATVPYNLGRIFCFSDGEDFFHSKKFSVEQNGYKLKVNPTGFTETEES